MKIGPVAGMLLGLAVAFTASVGLAATPQPPMNNFNSAFYRCDNNGAFNISYDDKRPKTAQMTTSNNSKTYDLKRASSADGAAFADGTVKFWTDGKTVKVEGTEVSLENCKLQN